jgi:hypothetical protein
VEQTFFTGEKQFGQGWLELNSGSKKLQHRKLQPPPMVDKVTVAAAGISHGTCHKILSDDLNMSCVTQHSVPRVLTQDQCDNCMNTCGDVIDSADKGGMFLNQIIAREET